VPTWFHPDLLTASGKAFLIALVLTPILRDVFRSYNIVDQPGVRKVHQYPIPRIGGIPIAVAYFAALWGLTATDPVLSENVWKLLPGAALIFFIGLLDDFLNLKPVVKLAGQVAAALLVFSSGLRMDLLANQPLPIWLNFLLTILWLLLSTNALNLIDGLDGLCAGIGLVATLTLFVAAFIQGNWGLVTVTLPLVGALIGFLSYNMSPATVFLGDSGAMLIGFLLGCYGMIWTQKTATLLSLLVPLLALAVPLLDVSLAILRRYISNRPIFGADRAHIHHRLLDHGLTPRKAVLTLYVFAAATAGIAILLSSPTSKTYQSLLLLLILGLIVIGVRRLRYQEFQIAGQILLNGEFRLRLREKMHLDQLRATLSAASSEADWWVALTTFGRDHGWAALDWDAPHKSYSAILTPAAVTLTLSIPLNDAGTLHIQVAGAAEDASTDLPALAWVLNANCFDSTAALEASVAVPTP
jgi:UDP-GlcNAc:undecaprenyl-phosphate GlcNAc-1-phosphate transferase